MASTSGVRIKKTHVGNGVFATRPYRKDQVIGQMTGSVITDDNYDPDYVVDLGKAGVLEPAPPFRFLNHSCQPNAALIEYDAERGENPTMWVEALRAIQPGAQITIDYGWPADSAIPCLCGSAKCRGWVVAASELPKVLRRVAKEAKAKAKAKAKADAAQAGLVASPKKSPSKKSKKSPSKKAPPGRASSSKATTEPGKTSKRASSATSSSTKAVPKSAKSASKAATRKRA
jgi:hypothetical protein